MLVMGRQDLCLVSLMVSTELAGALFADTEVLVNAISVDPLVLDFFSPASSIESYSLYRRTTCT
jgi:hypothetical protein